MYYPQDFWRFLFFANSNAVKKDFGVCVNSNKRRKEDNEDDEFPSNVDTKGRQESQSSNPIYALNNTSLQPYTYFYQSYYAPGLIKPIDGNYHNDFLFALWILSYHVCYTN